MTQSASIRNCTSFLTACSSLLCFNAPASLEKKTQPHDRPLKQFTGKLVTSSNVYNVLVLMAAHAHTHLLKGRTTVPLIDQVYHSNLQMLTVPHLRHNTAGAHIHKILKPRATGRLSTRMHTSKRFCFWHHYACISSHARKLKLFCSPPSAQHITPLCSASYTPPFCITHPSVLHHTPFRSASQPLPTTCPKHCKPRGGQRKRLRQTCQTEHASKLGVELPLKPRESGLHALCHCRPPSVLESKASVHAGYEVCTLLINCARWL